MSTHEERTSLQDSVTSEAYELDLPPVPGSGLYTNHAPRGLSLKAQSPIYGNVNRTLALDLEGATSPLDNHLSTIVETEDQHSSDSEVSSTSDDREDVSHLHSNPTSLTNDYVKAKRVFENQQYTQLHSETIDDPSIYEIPAKDIGNEHSGTYHRASPDVTEHQTEYIKMGIPTNSTTTFLKSRDQKPWRTFRRSFRRMYIDMKMVDMGGCCAGDHTGAKRFFTFSGIITFILLVAMIGIVVASVSWTVMRERANMLESNFNNYTTSLRYCRVGRNWTSVNISSNSGVLSYTVPVNSEILDVPLDNLTEVTHSCNVTALNAHQLLLYIVLRTYSNDSLDVMMLPSYNNVAMWTQSAANKQIQFRENVAILNDVSTPQIVSRSFWFPLLETDDHFYVNAQLMDGEPETEMAPIDFRLYLAGYC